MYTVKTILLSLSLSLFVFFAMKQVILCAIETVLNCLRSYFLGAILLRNLCWWCFFIQPLAQQLHLHSGNLHCEVVYRMNIQGSLAEITNQRFS